MTDSEKDILLDIHKKIWDTLPAGIQREKILALSWLPEEHAALFIDKVVKCIEKEKRS